MSGRYWGCEMGKKSGVTEMAILTTAVGVLEAANQFLTAQPLVPAPWGAVVTAGLGFLTLVLRTIAKKPAE